MATVDRDILLQEVLSILPPNNTVGEALMRRINERVIITVGDDELNHPEILCKCLRANAIQNMANATTSAGLKRDRTAEFELEYYNTTGKNFWKDWITSLKDICPLYGYTIPTNGVGAVSFITGSTPTLTIDTTCCTQEFT
jgi:hypothetical protein